MTKKSSPTRDVFQDWQHAYDFFNRELFNNTLPECLITVKAQPRSRGYFAWDRWENMKEAATTDEISMNSLLFAVQPLEITLSTLVHEMVHLWHYRLDFETFSKSTHNKAWNDKMIEVGLQPSVDGTVEGKWTKSVQSCTHYIIDGDRFAKAAEKLLADGFGLTWAENVPGVSARPATGGVVTGSGAVPVTTARRAKRKSKTAYTCSHSLCKAKAWAKSGMVLYCGDHERGPYKMTEADA